MLGEKDFSVGQVNKIEFITRRNSVYTLSSKYLIRGFCKGLKVQGFCVR